MRTRCNFAVVCKLDAEFVGTIVGCRFGESLDGYTSGPQRNAIDAQQSAAPGSGDSAKTVRTGDTAQRQGCRRSEGGEARTDKNCAGARHGTTPKCEPGTGRRDEGVYEPWNYWDVSKVMSRTSMLEGVSVFDYSLDKWNVFSVETMCYLFIGNAKYDENISDWNIPKINKAMAMFLTAKAFTELLDKWNVFGVENMSDMFMNAEKVDKDRSGSAPNKKYIRKYFFDNPA